MTLHAIGVFNGVDWKGDQPTVPAEVVEVHSQAGLDGLGFQLLGKHGEPFNAELTAHIGDAGNAKSMAELFETAAENIDACAAMREDDPVEVTWCGVSLLNTLGVKYKVISTKVVECRASVRIVGNGYDYHPAVVLRIQFTLRPVYVGVPVIPPP